MALDKFGGQIIDTSTDRFGGTIITDQNKGVLAKDAYEKSRDRVAKEARGFWESISNALVGEEAEWGEYWNRGLGKTNISLMSQYYFNRYFRKIIRIRCSFNRRYTNFCNRCFTSSSFS